MGIAMSVTASWKGKRVLVQVPCHVATVMWLLDHGARVTVASALDATLMRRIDEHLKRTARDGSEYEKAKARLAWNARSGRAGFDHIVGTDALELFLSAWPKKIIGVTGKHGKTTVALWAAHLIGDAVVAGHADDRPPMAAVGSKARVALVELHDTSRASSIELVNTDGKENRDTAVEIAKLAGASEKLIRSRLATLPQIPHCQEVVHRSARLTIIDDSAATSPERGTPAISQLGGPNCILVCGGAGGDMGYRAWADVVAARVNRTNIVFLAGTATRAMRVALGYRGMRGIRAYDTMEACLAAARKRAKLFVSAVILISPAAKSNDTKNQRGPLLAG